MNPLASVQGAKKRVIKPALIIAVSSVLALVCCGGAVSAVIFGDFTSNQSKLLTP
jgi:hypothetical protein